MIPTKCDLFAPNVMVKSDVATISEEAGDMLGCVQLMWFLL